MKTIWKLVSGGRADQESVDEKRAKAEIYIEKLESRGFSVSVVEHDKFLEINYEPSGD